MVTAPDDEEVEAGSRPTGAAPSSSSSRLATSNLKAATSEKKKKKKKKKKAQPQCPLGSFTDPIQPLRQSSLRNAAQRAGKAQSHEECQVKQRPEEKAKGKPQLHRGPGQ